MCPHFKAWMKNQEIEAMYRNVTLALLRNTQALLTEAWKNALPGKSLQMVRYSSPLATPKERLSLL